MYAGPVNNTPILRTMVYSEPGIGQSPAMSNVVNGAGQIHRTTEAVLKAQCRGTFRLIPWGKQIIRKCGVIIGVPLTLLLGPILLPAAVAIATCKVVSLSVRKVTQSQGPVHKLLPLAEKQMADVEKLKQNHTELLKEVAARNREFDQLKAEKAQVESQLASLYRAKENADRKHGLEKAKLEAELHSEVQHFNGELQKLRIENKGLMQKHLAGEKKQLKSEIQQLRSCPEITSQNSDTQDSVRAEPVEVRCSDPSTSLRVNGIGEIIKGQSLSGARMETPAGAGALLKEYFMTSSMTAFARVQVQEDWGSLVWEIRSVNHRYLELNFRLPEQARGIEPALREAIRQQLKRGKVECSLKYQFVEQEQALDLNHALLAKIHRTVQDIEAQFTRVAPVNPLELLQWPGVQATVETEVAKVHEAALQGFRESLTQLTTMRQREGRELKSFIEARLDKMGEEVKQLRLLLPEILHNQRERIMDRLAKARQELNPERLEQEMVFLAQKMDVDEELDRLETHIAEVSRTLNNAGQGGVGRRLDFLMQELNREANTLSSKSFHGGLTRTAVNLKVLIEQMREQVQNIE